MRIALFTPFSPDTGGGGVIFRSILPYLDGAEIRWFYLANTSPGAKSNYPNAVHLGPLIMGGPVVADGLNSFRLFVQQSHPAVEDCVRSILAWSPDIVWVNAMNEGLLVGKRLLDAGVKHLHVSVHDDPAGLAQKSSRYRIFGSFIDRCSRELLKRAQTVDAVCDSMQRYYSERIGVHSGVVYRYIHDLSLPTGGDVDKSTVLIGHVGSAYSAPEVFAFMSALRNISRSRGIQFQVMNFGVSPAMTAAEREFPDIVKNQGNVPEEQAIARLQACAFVYSMYSFSPRHRIFRETSQPTKMSTYLMAARPILVHCPPGSSTLDMLAKFKLGLSVSSLDVAEIAECVGEMLEFDLQREEVQRAADYYCGERNVDSLKLCFGLATR